MEKIVSDPEALTKYSIIDLVREAGAQGAELIMWLTMRGALGENVEKIHSNYHIPISNTGAGLLLLEDAA
jgi:protocatechuate 4,5-dioxygenase beta chain